MAGIFVVSAMVPTYLVEVLHLDTQSMGFVVSAIGFGGFIGSFGIAGVSDFIGRRNSAVISFVCAAVLLYIFSRTAPVHSFSSRCCSASPCSRSGYSAS